MYTGDDDDDDYRLEVLRILSLTAHRRWFPFRVVVVVVVFLPRYLCSTVHTISRSPSDELQLPPSIISRFRHRPKRKKKEKEKLLSN